MHRGSDAVDSFVGAGEAMGLFLLLLLTAKRVERWRKPANAFNLGSPASVEPASAMATTFFETPSHSKTETNPLGIKGIDHIEFIVEHADQWRDYFVDKFGMTPRFYADAKSGVAGRRAH